MPDRFLKYYTRLLHETEPYSTSTPSASVQVTTETPGQVFSFALLEANQPTTVEWGDGSSSEVPLSAEEVTHTYEEVGTYTVRFPNAPAISNLTYWGSGLTINSADIKHMSGLKHFEVYEPAGVFNTHDVRGWRPDFFAYESADCICIVDSADLVYWSPQYFDLSYLSDVSGRFNSSDIAHWRPGGFYFGRFLAAVDLVGTFDLGDLSDWRPSNFSIYAINDEDYTYILNSADIVDWRPNTFNLWQLGTHNNNLADTSGVIDSADFAAWSMQGSSDVYTSLGLDTLPSTVSVTVDFNHFSGWNLNGFVVRTMSHANVTVRTGVISEWTRLQSFVMSAMELSQSEVDMLLGELYEQSKVRVTTGNASIGLQSNAAPSGTYQAMCPPTTGKEFAYEIINDSCGVITNQYTSLQYTP